LRESAALQAKWWLVVLGAAGIVNAGLAVARAAEPVAAAPKPDLKALEFFETKVRPLLAQKCFACHSEKNTKGGLRLDTPAGFRKGGDLGPVVNAESPEKSRLLESVSYTKDLKMPPQGKLRPQEIADLTAWVKLGAPWPEVKAPAGAGSAARDLSVITDEQRRFWAFQPIGNPAPPRVKNAAWVASPIDAFLLARLEAKGLKPAPPADRRTLIRRVTFDLTGLPPTPAEIDAFLADPSPDAFAKVVDRLLASPAYGERWGRHWLDVARYADSNGLDENTAFANAWRYRDYVIRAFNQDKPYDEFLREQIAGDLLPASQDDAVNADRLTATAFLCLGPKVLAEPDKEKMVMDIVDEQVDTLGRTVMGLTLGCARCHDHKFDPVPTRDYYSLAGIFKSTRTMETLSTVARVFERPLADAETARRRQEHQAALQARQDALRRAQDEADAAATRAVVGALDRYLLAGTRVAVAALRDTAVVDPDRPGTVVVEAETFLRGDVQVTPSGGITYIESAGRTAAFTEYEVNLPALGEYQLGIRYASGEARPIRLRLGGRLLGERLAGRVTGGFDPGRQQWHSEGVYSLPAGKQVLRLEQVVGSLPHVDRIAFVPVPPVAVTAREAAGPRPRNLLPADLARQHSLDVELLRKSAAYVHARDAGDRVFAPWKALVALPDDGFALAAATMVGTWKATNAPAKWLPPVAEAFTAAPPRTLAEAAERYRALFTRANDAWLAAVQSQRRRPARLGNPDLEVLRQVLYAGNGAFGLAQAERLHPAGTAATVARLRSEAAELEKNAPQPLAMTLAVEEGRQIGNAKVHIRGNTQTLGDEVPRQFLRVIAGEKQTPIPADRSGRLELADWLTRPEHPLTARVMVNRIWLHHFGEGIVRSPDNFGLLGERPTHPELLDWLATQFIRGGWSIKAMHRQILLSNAYRMSAAHDARAALADPENRLLWRFNRRRLEVEAIRDSMLSVSGQLDRTPGGTLLNTKNFEYVTNDQSGNAARYDSPRRSIYLPVIRNAVFDVFQVFDFVEPSFLNGKRVSTTVAPQALFLLNGQFVLDQAGAWARVLLGETADDAGRVRAAVLRAYGRPATESEVQDALAFLKEYEATLTARQPDAARRRESAWAGYCQVLFAASEFVYVN